MALQKFDFGEFVQVPGVGAFFIEGGIGHHPPHVRLP